ncbi:MAG: MerR family transcriptional regulator [Deltaproteobacteria bacterium]|nr:MAG: MerR family transcriptional regulator [Deltaproteobacteria bacterium]
MAYRIRTVVDMTGIPRNTLLAWERRYGVPKPNRTDGGHRVYDDEDVQILHRLTQLLEKGHRIGEAVELLRKTGEPARADGEQPLDHLRDALRGALLAFDRVEADRAFHLISTYPIRRMIDDVLLPVLRDVGDRWHAGSVSIAQEHFTSAFVREQLITVLHRLESGPAGGPVALCAGFPGEQHEIPLLAVAVKLALRGWRIVYLGADLPLEDLDGLLHTRDVALICQSLINRREPDAVREHAQRLLTMTPPSTMLALGGPGVEPLTGESTDRLLYCATFEDLLLRLDR